MRAEIGRAVSRALGGVLLVGLLADASAGADAQIAFSKRLGVEVFAEDAGGGWCTPELRLRVHAQDAAFFASAELAGLIRQVGGQALAKQCAVAQSARVTGLAKGSAKPVYGGRAVRGDGGWTLAADAAAASPSVAPAAASAGAPAGDGSPAAALFAAAELGDLSGVYRVIEKGAGVDARDARGQTPLMRAAGSGQALAVHVLLAKGANVNAQDDGARTALLLAALEGHDAAVQVLLGAKAAVDPKLGDGTTPLIAASLEGHGAVVEALLSAGADVNARGGIGVTPLMGASAMGHAAVVRALVGRGADVNARDANGETALILAAADGHREVVEALLASGAAIDAKDLDGNTALAAASRGGHTAVAEVLRAAAGTAPGAAKAGALSYEQWEKCRAAAAASVDARAGGRQGVENRVAKECGDPPVREAGTQEGVGVLPRDLVRSKTWKKKFADITGDQYSAFLKRLDVGGETVLADGWIVGEGNAPHAGTIDDAALAIDARTGKVFAAMLVERSRVYGFGFGDSWEAAPPPLLRWARERGLSETKVQSAGKTRR